MFGKVFVLICFMSYQIISFCIQLEVFQQMNMDLLQLQLILLDLKSQNTPNAKNTNYNEFYLHESTNM